MSNTKKAVIALIIANIIWGAGPPIFKWSFGNIHVFTLAFLRMAIPTVILGFFVNKKAAVIAQDILPLLWNGLTNITFNIGLYFIGILYTASINASIIAAASPIFLICSSILILKEKPAKKVLFGNLIGMGGVMLIILQPIFKNTETASVFGNFLLVISAVSAVLGTISGKKLLKTYSPLVVTFWTFAIGTFTFFPFCLYETFHYGFLSDITYQGIIGITFGAVCSSLIAYLLNFWALKYLAASQTGVFSYLDPVASILIAAPLLHEYPSPLFILGGICVFAGIYVAERRINYHPLHKLFARM